MAKQKYSDEELAQPAFGTLNDLMGEIHAGRMVGFLALKYPSLFHTKHIKLIVHMGIGAIAIALYKYDDLWHHQLKKTLLADSLPAEGEQLAATIKEKKIRQFRSLFIAHYSDKPSNPKPGLTNLEEELRARGFQTYEAFFIWTKEVIKALQTVKDALSAKYNKSE